MVAPIDDTPETLRRRGNECYQVGRFEDARVCYDAAIAQLSTADGASADASNDDDGGVRVALAQLYSNRAQTFIQERSFAQAAQDASQALAFDATNEKAQLRLLIALENLERFEQAFQRVERVLEQAGARQRWPTLFEYAVAARRRLSKAMKQDRAAAQKERVAIERMVHDNQQLRINFGSTFPTRVAVGEFFDVAINIGNEFGLFRRDTLQSNDAVLVECKLQNDRDNAFRVVYRGTTSFSVETEDDRTMPPTPTDGVIRLNDRGKARFQIAVQAATDEAAAATPVMLALAVYGYQNSKCSLLPVVSLPFQVVSQAIGDQVTSEHIEADAEREQLGVHCCRPVVLPGLEREILLAESPGNLGIGGKLWDSCLVLTRYLRTHPELLQGRHVIELGSGLGLVGIYCAMLGAHVTLTDMEEVIPLLDYNIRLNFKDSTAQMPRAVAHMWGTSTERLGVTPDVIVMSDVVYDPEGYAPLVTSLTALAKTPATTILMAHRSRNPMEGQFFDLLGQQFDVKLVQQAATDRRNMSNDAASRDGVSHPSGCSGSERSGAHSARDSRDERVLQDVKIFQITRRSGN
ncbi:hypothetical protein PINS_up000753 [Pythium insidiosum]|nr:hypothetical protein PINS_up000753 [Pythium insidiosum]